MRIELLIVVSIFFGAILMGQNRDASHSSFPKIPTIPVPPIYKCSSSKNVAVYKYTSQSSIQHFDTVSNEIKIIGNIGDIKIVEGQNHSISIEGIKTIESDTPLSNDELSKFFDKLNYIQRKSGNIHLIQILDGKEVIGLNSYFDVTIYVPSDKNLSVSTDVGCIDISTFYAQKLFLKTDTGYIKISQLSSKTIDKIDLRTDTGDIHLTLLNTISAKIKIRSDMGTIRTWRGVFEKRFSDCLRTGKGSIVIYSDMGNIELVLW